MASQLYKPSAKRISLEAFGLEVARRRETVGTIDMPRNAGNRRTESKRSLLTEIEATGARW